MTTFFMTKTNRPKNHFERVHEIIAEMRKTAKPSPRYDRKTARAALDAQSPKPAAVETAKPTKEDPAAMIEEIIKHNDLLPEEKRAEIEPAKPAETPELETYTLPAKRGRILTEHLVKICKNVSERTRGKRDFIIFRGDKITAVPANIVKPLARLFDQVMSVDIESDRVVFMSEDNRSKTVIKSIPFDKVGKLIAVDLCMI